MPRKVLFWLLWLGFVGYAFLFAPPDHPQTLELIKNLSTGNVSGINPLIVALFNIMGVLPLMYLPLLLVDGRGQKIISFPFAIASFFVGAFGLLPYLALREENSEFIGEKNRVLTVFDSRIFALFLNLLALGLIIYGVTKGDWNDFVYQWNTSKFIHVMTLDFCLLSILFPTLVKDDMNKRGMENNLFLWLVSLVPLLGTLIYLLLRSPLIIKPLEEN
jgi:hypothetical protein